MSLQDNENIEQNRKIARAWGRMVAAVFNAVASFHEALGAFFDVIRSLLEAAGLGFRRSAKEIGNVFAALLREKLTSWLLQIRRARAVPTQSHRHDTEVQAVLTATDNVAPSSMSLQIAMRQAELARETAERFRLEAANKVKSALIAAERADDAARQHRSMLWEQPSVGPLFFKNNAIIYHGELRHGEASGYGVFEEGTSIVYRGQVRGNRKNGLGVCSQGGQASYEGEFKSHQRDGLGRLKTNTYEYIGQFIQDEIRQYGILTHVGPGANWEKHLGFFERAEANGYGVRHFADGHIHSGEFKNDIPYGFGIRTLEGIVIQAGRWEGEECHKL